MMVIVKNYLNKNSTSCALFPTKCYKSEMGKTIVRIYAPTLYAQSVWKDFETHMSTSSKGLNERYRLHAYVSTAVYDRSWKGTTEQFVLHVHQQFRQLDELTPLKEQFPHSVRLTLLQTAVRSVPELRIVGTMEDFMSLTHSYSGHFSITNDKYFMMLQNACIRYDKTLKHKPSSTSKAAYQHELDAGPGVHDEEDDYLDDNFAPDGIDTPSDDIYNVHNGSLPELCIFLHLFALHFICITFEFHLHFA